MPEENIIRVRLSLTGRPIKSYSFDQDVITIGRDPGADIYLDNPGVSREHARIERLSNGHYSVKDSGSANGTFLNEDRIETAMVYDTDVVRIGKYSLWLKIERDRRGDEITAPARRQPGDPSAETMMLSSTEIERLMSVSRERESARAAAPEPAMAQAPAPQASGDASRSRVPMLVGIGAVLILATSVGAGIAWLFLR